MSDSLLVRPPWDGQPYSVKRHGVTIDNCDSEPVQTPGCIQGHGVLLVLRRTDLAILQVSENSERWFGAEPAALLGQAIVNLLGSEREAKLRECLSTDATDDNPLYVFTLDSGSGIPLDVTLHTSNGLVVLEFEPAPHDTQASEPDYYRILRKAVGRLQGARTLAEYCQTVTEEVRSFTALDRVMVYRFHEDGHGEVIAESARADLPPWLGMHYPAEDIPKPARDIFAKLWIRPVPDVSAELCELVPLLNPDTRAPLNMTYCALRGPSVMYTEYLQNMGVKGALTLSIRREGQLWGLIACHHYASTATFPYQVRAACEFFAQVISLQLKSAEDRDSLVYRLKLADIHQQLVSRAAEAGDLGAFTGGSPALIDAIEATGGAICYRKHWWTVGDTPSTAELDALGDWLHSRPELQTHGVYATDSLLRDYPAGEAFGDRACGLLAIPLSLSHKSFLLWFRPETIRTVNWGGNPHDKPTVTGPHGPRLTPRKSFELFTESVRLRSLPWRPVEIEAARQLRPLLLDLVLNQSERLANLNADLQRSNEDLDAFAYVASHDLKEPLRGIHKYAHQLREETALASDDQQSKLDGLIRLTLRMDSLLDSLLYFSRVGREALNLDRVDLSTVLNEALEMVEARSVEAAAEVVIPRPLPVTVCDRVRVREVFVNLLSNALKYSDKPQRRIEIGYLAPNEPGDRGNQPKESLGQTVYFVRDDGIGIQPRHRERIFSMFTRLHGRERYGGGTGAGLTIAKKLIERHGGRIWLESTPGKGSTFFFSLLAAVP